MYTPPFKITSRILNLVAEISAMIERYAILLEQDTALRLRKANRIKTIHSSLAIEGNELTEGQVRDIINGCNVVAPLREILEVKNAIATDSNDEQIGHIPIKENSTFPNNIPNIFPNNFRSKYPQVSQAAWLIASLLNSTPGASAEQVGQALGISGRMVRNHIATLRNIGIIERVGSNKTGYWKVNRIQQKGV